MARFNTVQLNSIYFTDDGTGSGTPCKLAIKGLDALKTAKTGQTVQSADGAPFLQIVENSNKGLVVSITPVILMKDVFDSLTAEIAGAIENETTIDLEISGDTGDFSLTVLPLLPNPIQFSGDFLNARIKSPTFNFITT